MVDRGRVGRRDPDLLMCLRGVAGPIQSVWVFEGQQGDGDEGVAW
jgi:hypothetical protein